MVLFGLLNFGMYSTESLLLTTELCRCSVGAAGSGLVSVILEPVATLWNVLSWVLCGTVSLYYNYAVKI